MPEPNFRNRTLYHGDNLDFLRGMNSGLRRLNNQNGWMAKE